MKWEKEKERKKWSYTQDCRFLEIIGKKGIFFFFLLALSSDSLNVDIMFLILPSVSLSSYEQSESLKLLQSKSKNLVHEHSLQFLIPSKEQTST